jgi:ribosome recycling factor
VIDDTLLEAEDKMDKALSVAQDDFAGIRTGRANPAMFNKMTVDYYGTDTPIQQLASFATPEARLIVITPYDKSAMDAIEKVIRDSDLGVNPASDGNVIRVALPQLTEERRKEYVKQAKGRAEDARIAVRNIRRSANQVLEKMIKDGDAGEDDVKRAEKHLDEITNKHVAHIDDMLKHKESELLEV